MLASGFFQTHHYYRSSQLGQSGQTLTFCGSEKAVHKQIQKDADKKDRSSSNQSNLPDFQIITHDAILFTSTVFSSVTAFFGYSANYIPSQHTKGIFQPPRLAA